MRNTSSIWQSLEASFWARMLLGAAILLAPALINGFPFYFYDTIEYHQLGAGMLNRLVEMLPHASSPGAEPAAAPSGAPHEENGLLTYLGGRSPLYSLFLALSYALGSYWFAAVAQTLVASWLISTSLRVLGRPSLRDFLTTIALMTAFTALPFFSAELMPDVLTGYAFIAIALIFLGSDSIGRIERWALALLVFAAAFSHQSNLPLAVLLTALALAATWLLRLPRRKMLGSAGLIGAALALAIAGNFTFTTATRIVLGQSAGNPPYLMARVLADGPGRLYLRDACADARFEICRYADRTFANENDFLWNPDPHKGVFIPASIDSRRRLMAEERAFVLAVITRYPLEQLTATARNAFSQITRAGITPELELARDAWLKVHFADIAPNDDARVRASLAFREIFPFRMIDTIDGAALLLALAFLAWRLTRKDVVNAFGSPNNADTNTRRALAVIAATLALWLIANAILCGALSGAFDRYQARTIWVVPLLAWFTLLRLGPAFAFSSSRTSKAAAPQS